MDFSCLYSRGLLLARRLNRANRLLRHACCFFCSAAFGLQPSVHLQQQPAAGLYVCASARCETFCTARFHTEKKREDQIRKCFNGSTHLPWENARLHSLFELLVFLFKRKHGWVRRRSIASFRRRSPKNKARHCAFRPWMRRKVIREFFLLKDRRRPLSLCCAAMTADGKQRRDECTMLSQVESRSAAATIHTFSPWNNKSPLTINIITFIIRWPVGITLMESNCVSGRRVITKKNTWGPF